MASLGLIALVASVLGNLNGLLGAEARASDTQSVTGLESQTWPTADPVKGHEGHHEASRAGGWAIGHSPSASREYPSSMALGDMWKPAGARLWQFFAPPEQHFAHFLGFHHGRPDRTSSETLYGWPGDLTERRQIQPHNFELQFGEYGERAPPQPLFENVGMVADQEGARPIWRSPRNSYHSNGSGGRKHRAKRSCVLRRINRFLRRFQMITGRGIIGDLIRAAGGIQGNLQIYRIAPNTAGAQGLGVLFRAGTPNWRGFTGGDTSLVAESPGRAGVTRRQGTDGADRTGWNEVASGAATNTNPSRYGNAVDAENIGSVDDYNGE